MSTAIVPSTGQQPPTKNAGLSLQHLDYIAQNALEAGFFGRDKVKNKAGAVMLILAGQSMGLDPYTALTEIYLIDGKPSMSANLMRSLVLRSGDWDVIEVEKTSTRVELHWLKKDGTAWKLRGKSIWTIERAKTAGLAGKDNFRKYPEAMLLARATSEGFRAYCPHLVGGMSVYTPDELRDEPEPAPLSVYTPTKADTATDAVIVTQDEQRAEKVQEIATLIDANGINEVVFLKHYKVDGIARMTPVQMDKALTVLRARDNARVAKEKQDAQQQQTATDDGMPVVEPHTLEGE